MNYFFDNNLSPHLAAGIAAFSRYDARIGQVVHLRTKFDPCTPDEDWLRALADEGLWCVVSRDAFNKSRAERELVRQHGLSVVTLARQWNVPFWEQAQLLVEWWPTIVSVTSQTHRAAYRVPFRRNPKRLETLV